MLAWFLISSLVAGSTGLGFDVPVHSTRCFRELFPAGKPAVLEYECGKPEILVQARDAGKLSRLLSLLLASEPRL